MADTEGEIGFAQLGLGSVLKQNQLSVPTNHGIGVRRNEKGWIDIPPIGSRNSN